MRTQYKEEQTETENTRVYERRDALERLCASFLRQLFRTDKLIHSDSLPIQFILLSDV